MKNFTILVACSAEHEIDVVNLAAKIAELSKETAEIRECGTGRSVCMISPDGCLLFRKATTK